MTCLDRCFARIESLQVFRRNFLRPLAAWPVERLAQARRDVICFVGACVRQRQHKDCESGESFDVHILGV